MTYVYTMKCMGCDYTDKIDFDDKFDVGESIRFTCGACLKVTTIKIIDRSEK